MPKDLRKVAMEASLGIAVLMLGGKLTAYYLTGSTAILSDAAESIIHIVATLVAGLSLWYAELPADRRHPYGYGKVAYFSAGLEGALILSAALFILAQGLAALLTGPTLHQLGWGIAITGGLALVNLGLGLFLVHVGKTQNALILVANGKHVLADMWTSAGVVGGVTLVWATGLNWLDPVVAIAVGLNILVSAFRLIDRAFRGLLDAADPEKTKTLLDSLQKAVDEGLLAGFHQLRHRQSNDNLWVEVHMLLPGRTTTLEAHTRVTRVEQSVRDLFPDYTVYVTSHIEPARHERAHPDGHPGQPDPFGE